MAIQASIPGAAFISVGNAGPSPGIDQPEVTAALVELFAADTSGTAMRP